MLVNTIQSLLEWIKDLTEKTHVMIEKINLSDSDNWFYDEQTGEITNSHGSFFQVKGLQKMVAGQVVLEQPVIVQNEIGYLGIICQEINGEMYYLMQAKIEPGNINKIQISPTIQATRSNFTQRHGGRRPAYLNYFLNASKYTIIVDQIQSEQSSRFYRKRNRNIIIEVNEDIEILPSHRWMTIGQIKALMRIDNLVNMDTRTVLSCLPLVCMKESAEGILKYAKSFTDVSLVRSIQGVSGKNYLPEIYQYINNYKMFDESQRRLVPLYSLKHWKMIGDEFVSDYPCSYKIVFCDIEIEGREVKHWTQPLVEALGIATFGLLTCVEDGVKMFLVRALPEIGCFDGIELSPSVQREFIDEKVRNTVDDVFDRHLSNMIGVKFDTLLSEEGGRFYCEQNRNVVVEIDKTELDELPEGYFWTDYRTLNCLVQVNNCLNVQLRNLLSVLEW